MLKKVIQLDNQIEQYIYLHRYHGADAFLSWCTTHATIISFSLLLLLALGYFVRKQRIYIYTALNAAVLTGLTALASNAIKLSVERLRPYEVMEQIKTPLIYSGGYSFPSGHTTEVFTLFFTVAFLIKNKWLKGVFLFWALLIAYTRMAFGVHYPLDVTGGIVLSYLMVRIWLKYQPLQKWFSNMTNG